MIVKILKLLLNSQILIIFYDMVKDMLSNTKFNPVVTELFIRGRKLNLFLIKSSDIDYEWSLRESFQKMYCETKFFFSDWYYSCIR